MEIRFWHDAWSRGTETPYFPLRYLEYSYGTGLRLHSEAKPHTPSTFTRAASSGGYKMWFTLSKAQISQCLVS